MAFHQNTFAFAFALASSLALAGCLDPGEPGNLVPKTVDQDPTLPRIEVAGALFHSESFGDPGHPTIMVLHGGPGADYRSLLPLRALADVGYRVVFWDQRGSGLSQRFDSAHYTLEGYLEDLRLVIEKTVQIDQPFVFIGHSWGAMYATWFIDRYGDHGGRVKGAILSEPGAFTKAQLDKYLARLLGSLNFFGEQVNDATWAGQFMSAADHARADYLSSVMSSGGTPAEGLDPQNPYPEWRSGAVVSSSLLDLVDKQGFDWTTKLSQFTPKVLFLRGDLNTAMPLWHQQELALSYPNAEIVTMPNVGHEMIWERPVEYLAHTRAYLQSIGFVGAAK